MHADHPFRDYEPLHFAADEMERRGREFLQLCAQRRSVRAFATQPVPRRLIELAIESASTAPSGAHRQPWKFVAISNPALKRQIRAAAEAEEQAFYSGRAPDAWIEALAPLRTGWQKPYLETAPWLVVVFEELQLKDETGARPNYYTKESVGIACGLFILALHNMGLVTLTHTPSPMRFLSQILQRPAQERPYILFPVGFPEAGVQVPDLRRKSLSEVAIFLNSDAVAPPSGSDDAVRPPDCG